MHHLDVPPPPGPSLLCWTLQEKSKDPIIPFSGALEQNLVDMPEDEAEAHCKELGATSALPKIIKTGFTALNLIYFFTGGPDEVKCWTIRKGYKAPQAAGTIHTDFERGFICAEVRPGSLRRCHPRRAARPTRRAGLDWALS